jgi:hypothetical protein
MDFGAGDMKHCSSLSTEQEIGALPSLYVVEIKGYEGKYLRV